MYTAPSQFGEIKFCALNYYSILFLKYEKLVPLDVLQSGSNNVLRAQMNEKNHILRCLLPKALKEQLRIMPSREDDQYMRLDLYRGETPVLANVTVRRLHEMDRRSFKVRTS